MRLTARVDHIIDLANVAGSYYSITTITLDNLSSRRERCRLRLIGLLTVSDPDQADGHTLTVDDARFEIVAGELRLKAGVSLDYETETSVTVTVTATDAQGLPAIKAFMIAVGDVDDAPTAIALDNLSVDENDAGAVIGALTVSDPDQTDGHTFTVNDARFEIVAGELRLKVGESLDYETEASVTVTVTATDAQGLTVDEDFTIEVGNVAEGRAPTALSGRMKMTGPAARYLRLVI